MHDHYGGITVSDPYRWMETDSSELQSYLELQEQYSTAFLASLPGREQLGAELKAADQGVARVLVDGVVGESTRVFYRRQSVDDESYSLYYRDGWAGRESLLFAPSVQHSEAIDFVAPAPDGKTVALGVSTNGTEDSVIRLVDVATGTFLPDRIDRAQYGSVSWRADSRSFYYWRRAKPATDSDPSEWFKNSSSHLHVIGRAPDAEPALLGPSLPGLGIEANAFPLISTYPRSRWTVGVSTTGGGTPMRVFVSDPGPGFTGALPPLWRSVAVPSDGVIQVDAYGDHLYLLTHLDAPRYRVLRVPGKTGTIEDAETFVPETTGVIEGIASARDGLYVLIMEDGLSRLRRRRWDGATLEEVQLPFEGWIRSIQALPDSDGVIVALTSWLQAPRWYRYDPADGSFNVLRLGDESPHTYPDLEASRVRVTSQDGTAVSLTLISRKGLKRDGLAPAWLAVYGAYGLSITARLEPKSLVWARHGGVIAYCHGRGGGERGRAWHLAGRRENKERGVEDVVACARYLVENRWTSAKRLTIHGRSAGGLLVGGAITREPALFAAAILAVPVANLLRFEHTPGGPANADELGSTSDPSNVPWMLATDPYHRVRAGVEYPAVMLTGSATDVRVPIWQPSKLAAMFQAKSTSDRPILLRVDRSTGHGLMATRSQAVDELADSMAFALDSSGISPAEFLRQ